MEQVQEETCMIVGKESLAHAFEVIAPALQELLDDHTYGEATLQDVYDNLVLNRSQLWMALRGKRIIAWAVTHIDIYPQKKHLVVDYLGGSNMDDWAHYSALMENFAAAYECTEIEAWCRKGFTKTLRKHGFREAYIIMLKPVMRNLQ